MTLDPVQAWAPEPRPIDPELTDTFEAEPYVDPWNSIMERLSLADREALRLLAAGGIGEPHISYRQAEIGGE